MRLCIYLLVCLVQLSLKAQDTTLLFTQLRERSAEALRHEPDDSPLRLAYTGRDETLMQEIRDSVYLFDGVIYPYLDSLMRHIGRTNGLDTLPIVLVDYAADRNASSLGNGIFVVNLGLLLSLQREEELLFVLSHELAHDALGHHAAALRERGALYEELEPTLRKLHRPSPLRGRRRTQALNKRLRDQFYGVFRGKRQAELQADSLALHFYHQLSLPTAFAASALDDTREPAPDTLAEDALVRLLETAERPLEDEWLRPRPRLFGGSFGAGSDDGGSATFWQADSLSTHPARAERQAALVATLTDDARAAAGAGTPVPHRHELLLRLIDGQLHREVYGPALVLSLRLLREDPVNPTLRELTGRALFGVYRAAKQHDFDEAVPPAGYFRPGAARAVISMLRRMTTEEIAALTEAYLIASAPLTYAEARTHFQP